MGVWTDQRVGEVVSGNGKTLKLRINSERIRGDELIFGGNLVGPQYRGVRMDSLDSKTRSGIWARGWYRCLKSLVRRSL